jgi:hypothetical protein
MNEIQSKVLIVKPTISMLGNTGTDEEITEEVHDREHMDTHAGRYVKNLYPAAYLRPVQKVAREARRYHKTQTVCSSFGDILPTVLFEKYQIRINEFIDSFNDAARVFHDQYDDILAEARRIHNGQFKPEFYPAKHLVREQFRITLFTAPMPRSGDVVLDFLTEDRLIALRQQLDGEAQRAGEVAGQQVMARVLSRVAKICETLTDPEAVFRDSLIDNLREVLEIAPALNIAGNPDVSRLVTECRDKLLKAPDTLREVSAVRELTAAHAKNIALRFGQMGGRKLAA